MYDVYLFDMLFTKFLWTQIFEILFVVVNKMFVWSLDFSRKND